MLSQNFDGKTIAERSNANVAHHLWSLFGEIIIFEFNCEM